VSEALSGSAGVTFSGDANAFPTPLEHAGDSGVHVGRLRVSGRVVEYWCVSDNLLKGAATNAVQIAESLVGVHARA
jgi:aspartate-semialdehyde dehydrogenase